jgi:glycosyltransferase involved in cell wall biosynthesis
MTALPLVSVLIPTFNQDAFVGTAIQSALSQDYPNLEVVVSDDSSTDETRAIVSGFDDSRLRYEPSRTNLGRTLNYRRGLYDLARGEWVLNLDGDDFLVDTTFIRAAIAAVKDPVALVFGDRYVGDEHMDPQAFPSGTALSVHPQYLDGTTYVLSLPGNRLRIHHLCVLYRRKVALPLDFYRADIVSCDYESIFRLVLGRQIAHIPACVAVWRRHQNNASRAHDAAQSIRNYQLFQNVRDFAVEKLGDSYTRSFDSWLERNVANRYYGNMLSYYRNGDFAGLGQIHRFVKSMYPGARRRALTNPKNLARCVLAFIAGISSRAFSRAVQDASQP